MTPPIPAGYALKRVHAGFHTWDYALECARAASRASGERYRVYRDVVGFGLGWRVGKAIVR